MKFSNNLLKNFKIIIVCLIFSNSLLSQSLSLVTNTTSNWTITKVAQPFNINPLPANTGWLTNKTSGPLNSDWTDKVQIANLASTQIDVNNSVGNNSKPIWIAASTCDWVDPANKTIQYHFRNTFFLEEGCQEVTSATLRYACDNLSRIYINGVQIVSANGFYPYPGIILSCPQICGIEGDFDVNIPAATKFNSRPFDVVEIANIKSLLVPGINVIAMEIINTGGCAINYAWINANLQIKYSNYPVEAIVDNVVHKSCNTLGSFKIETLSGKAPFLFKVQDKMNDTGFFDNLVPGIYTVEITDANNCTTSIEVEVKEEGVIPVLIVSEIDSIIDCSDDNSFIKLTGSGGASIQYSFDNGPYTSQNQFNDLSAGQHTVSVINEYGCKSNIISFEVYSNTEYYLKFLNANFCPGDSISFLGKTYNSFGTFLDTIPSPGLCDTLYVIDLISKPNTETNLDIQLCFGESISLGNKVYNTSGSYIQSIPLATSCDSILNIKINVLEEKRSEQEFIICKGDSVSVGNLYYLNEGSFQQTISSESGCDSALFVRIELKDDELCENGTCGKYFIPNVFTPNNDGINDEFAVEVRNINITYMAIYNRWGGVVYSSNELNPKWNGYFADQEAQTGVYVYMIRGHCFNNIPFLKYGDVTLIR